MRLRISIRYLLLAANSLILLMPVFAVVFFHLWEGHLVRLTEQQLIAESVLIGEAWRERLLQEGGAKAGMAEGFAPIEPLLELNYDLLPPAAEPERYERSGEGAAWRAGQGIRPFMERAQRVNLSA